jgi:hypothetical protein
MAEVGAQQTGPGREFAHAGSRGERGEILHPLVRAAVFRLDRRRGELRERVGLYPHISACGS